MNTKFNLGDEITMAVSGTICGIKLDSDNLDPLYTVQINEGNSPLMYIRNTELCHAIPEREPESAEYCYIHLDDIDRDYGRAIQALSILDKRINIALEKCKETENLRKDTSFWLEMAMQYIGHLYRIIKKEEEK